MSLAAPKVIWDNTSVLVEIMLTPSRQKPYAVVTHADRGQMHLYCPAGIYV